MARNTVTERPKEPVVRPSSYGQCQLSCFPHEKRVRADQRSCVAGRLHGLFQHLRSPLTAGALSPRCWIFGSVDRCAVRQKTTYNPAAATAAAFTAISAQPERCSTCGPTCRASHTSISRSLLIDLLGNGRPVIRGSWHCDRFAIPTRSGYRRTAISDNRGDR